MFPLRRSWPFFSQSVSTDQFCIFYSKCILALPSACPLPPAQAQATISCPLGHLLTWSLHLLPIYSLQSTANTIFLSLSSVQDPCFDSCKVSLALLMKYDSSRRMHSLPCWSWKFCLTFSACSPSVAFRRAASSGEPPGTCESGSHLQLDAAMASLLFILSVLMVTSVLVF